MPRVSSTPVLVVGAGPIGLALAGDLGWRGTPCALIESGDGAVYQAKMDMVGIRTMEYCRRWGIVPWVEQAGYNRDYPQDCVWVTSLTGWELGRERFPSPRDERPPAESPQKRERCPQNFFDPVLARFVRQYPHVTTRYLTSLAGFEEHADRSAIVRAMGREFDFEILSVLPWVRRQLVADSYGTRRAFIAGDAAHLTSPTGGFGMNTGIQDSVNLAWKLAACLDGWGGGTLLA